GRARCWMGSGRFLIGGPAGFGGDKFGHVEEAEGVVAPESFAGGEPVAVGVVAAAGTFFLEESALDGAFEPAVDGGDRGPGELVPGVGDVVAREFFHDIAEKRLDIGPGLGEDMIFEGAVGEVIIPSSA